MYIFLNECILFLVHPLLNDLTLNKKVFANFATIVFSGSCICRALSCYASDHKGRTVGNI